MAKPTNYPLWAKNDVVDPIAGSNNKSVPSSQKQAEGQGYGQNTTRQDINYLFDLIDDWIQWFDGQVATNDLHITSDTAKTSTDVKDQLGGDWTDRGLDSLYGGTNNVRIFTKD